MKKYIQYILVICSICFFLLPFSYISTQERAEGYGKIDFAVFYAAGSVLAERTHLKAPEIYIKKSFRPFVRSMRHQSGGTKFLYPPQAAVCFIVFTYLSLDHATNVWLIFNITSFVCAYYLIIHMLVRDDWKKYRYSLFLGLLSVSGPVQSLMRTGQINALILTLLIGALVLIQKKSAWSGALLALATSLKIFPVLFAILLVAKKQWRALGAFFATLFALWIATVPFFGWRGLLRFYEYPFKAIMAGTINNLSTSPSLYGTFVKLANKTHAHVHDLSVVLGITVSILLVLSVIAIGYAYAKGKASLLLAYSSIVCAILLFSKFVQSQYMLYLLPPALLLLSKFTARAPLRALGGCITMYCLFFWNFFPALNSLLLHRVTLIGVLCMTAYCVYALRHQPNANTLGQK